MRRRSCQDDGSATRTTCTAVTLYSGQLVAQSEYSVVTTLAPDSRISGSLSTARVTTANAMKAETITSMASAAASPGVRPESRVSSLTFSVTSQPQKKNIAITAPAAMVVKRFGKEIAEDFKQKIVAKGIGWNVGKVFHRDRLVFRFDLLPEPHHQMPAMINLQQYYMEETLVDACTRHPLVDLRWKHRLLSLTHDATGAQLTVEREGEEGELEFVLVREADPRLEIALVWTEATDEYAIRVPSCDQAGSNAYPPRAAIEVAVYGRLKFCVRLMLNNRAAPSAMSV